MNQNLIFGILFLKILFWKYNFFIFVQTCQGTSSEFFFNFRSSSRKSQSQKDHSFHNTVLLKKPHSFYEPQLT